jgi:phospholipid/cholesterol/gamma-HCH transport system substrate-binding protein
METHTQKFKIRLGFFITGGILIFAFAIFIIGKQQNLFNPVFKVTADFYNVSGLQVGNNVRFSGINVGTVDKIKIINDSTVRVEMMIRRSVQKFIKTDSEAGIGSEGIIGDRVVIIAQGTNEAPMVTSGQHLMSNEPVETDAIILSLQASAVNSEIITKQLAEIMVNINQGQGTLGMLIKDSTIADNISQTIKNFKKSSEGLDETIDTTKENVFAFMESLKITASKTEIASMHLGEIMVKINSGQGTLGMLIQDTVTAKNLNNTIINLNSSSKGLEENIEALKHSIFFRGYFRRKAIEDAKNLEEAKSLELLNQEEKVIKEMEELNRLEDLR